MDGQVAFPALQGRSGATIPELDAAELDAEELDAEELDAEELDAAEFADSALLEVSAVDGAPPAPPWPSPPLDAEVPVCFLANVNSGNAHAAVSARKSRGAIRR
jgi:hypothetical protein